MEEVYNRIVLIGNGYDKALGLNTSYSDFILHYLQRALIEKIKNQGNLYNLISLDNINPQILSNNSQIIIGLHNTKTVNECLELLEGKVQIIYKNKFFQNILNESKDARWVDIEQLYYVTLKREYRNYKTNPGSNNDISGIISLNKCMDELTTALNIFIKEQQTKNRLPVSLDALLGNICEPLRKNISSLVKRHSRHNAPTGILFLNFNYTNTVLNLINNLSFDSGIKHISIHGTVNNLENPIIFGYGDDTSEDFKELESEGENELLRMIKSYKYPRTHNYHNLLNYLDLGDFDVFVIGHSCGLSDRTLLKTIFEHKNCLAIQNFHYRGESEDFEKRMEISRHFSNKILMRERVLPFDNYASIPQCQMNL